MNQKQLTTAVAVVAGLAVVAVFFYFGNPFMRGSAANSAAGSQASSGAGLVVQDESIGTGETAQAGDTVSIRYIGKLQDGTIFDQSSAHTDVAPGCTQAGEVCFQLGAGKVILGLDQGLQGMKVGGKRLLIIPPELGYGANQVGPIPANSTLIFEIDLVDVQKIGTTSVQ